jgi:hypothetical protein
MSKLTTSYNTVTIESGISKKDLDTTRAYAEGANVLKDEKDNPLFAVGYGSSGSVGQYGVQFNATTPEGKMFFSFPEKLPDSPTDRKAYLLDKFGGALFSLNAVEQQITAALAARAGQIANVADSVIVG